ncbi:MAG TPA: hypothetical protein VNF29_11090 [Candidatus Binataceae bacterium]|nr:hypothetical protein [Candidatus Binataceae bacterium]
MRSSTILKLTAVGLAFTLTACGVIQAQRQAQEAKKQEFVQRVDFAHIWVTSGTPPPGKPYTVLGDISYTVPFSPDAIDSAEMKEKLKKIAYKKWPDTIDAIIKENSVVSDDAAQVTVTAQAIAYDSTTDREALHKMNEQTVASPSGN